jgi:hypothetical protein
MALRLRRGTDAERLVITPLEGELIYTTDTKLLYVGDGTTAGGKLVTGSGGGGGISSLADDPSPELSNNLNANNNDITGLDIASGTTANFSIITDGTTVITGGEVSAEIISAEEFNGRFQGDLINDSSTVVFNSATSTISNVSLNTVALSSSLAASGEDIINAGTVSGAVADFTDLEVETGTFTNVVATDTTVTGILNAELVIAEEFNGRFQGDLINDSSTVVFNSATNNLNVNNIESNIVNAELVVAEEFNGRFQGDLITDSSTVVFDSANNNLNVNNIDGNILTVNTIETGIFEATTSVTTPLLLDTSRQIRVGNAQFPHSLVISNDSGGADDYIKIFTNTDTSNRSWGIKFNVSRGSVDTPTAIAQYDQFSGLSWQGHDGTTYRPGAAIFSYSVGAATTNSSGAVTIPTALTLSVNDASGDEKTVTLVDGNLFLEGTITASSYTGDITGSVFADDSTILIDAVNGEIPGYVKVADLKTALQDGAGDYAAFKSWVLANL